MDLLDRRILELGAWRIQGRWTLNHCHQPIQPHWPLRPIIFLANYLSKDYTIAWWHQTICLSCRARESIWFRTKNILIFIKASLMITFIKVNSSWFWWKNLGFMPKPLVFREKIIHRVSASIHALRIILRGLVKLVCGLDFAILPDISARFLSFPSFTKLAR